MNILRYFVPMGLLIAGAVMLLAGLFTGWSDHDTYLFVSFLLIVSGVVLHVLALKKESKY